MYIIKVSFTFKQDLLKQGIWPTIGKIVVRQLKNPREKKSANADPT